MDIVNIGINDEKHEEDACLLLYDTYDNVCKKMENILPEFSASMDLSYEKQHKLTIWFNVLETICGILKLLVVPFVIYAFNRTVAIGALFLVGVLFVIGMFNNIISYFTEGTLFGEDYIKCVTGVTEKTYQWIAYDKIQYVDFYYNKLSKRCGVMHAKVHILAKSEETKLSLPYFSIDKGEKLRKYVIEKECNII